MPPEAPSNKGIIAFHNSEIILPAFMGLFRGGDLPPFLELASESLSKIVTPIWR